MPYPKKLAAKFLGRIAELIVKGEQIVAAKQHVPAKYSNSATYFDGRPAIEVQAHVIINFEDFVFYRTNVVVVLQTLIPETNLLYEQVKAMATWNADAVNVQVINSILRAVENDLKNGFLDDVADSIEAEVTADYLTQAEELLKEGKFGNFDHVPAAVLAGAVLEKALRSFCDKHSPPIPTVDKSGAHKTLSPLIDDLKKAGQFTELTAKQLRAWADIRNKAAHGEFDAFSRADVETMLKGITAFLANL